MSIDPKTFPRKLSSRDFRTALDIIQTLSENIMTKETVNELAKEGIKPDSLIKGMKVVEQPPTESYTVLCAPYDFQDRLIFPDNHVINCDGCKTMLQIRPNADLPNVKKLCYFCGAQAALDEYWEEQDTK